MLHTALRRPASEEGTIVVDGQDVVADVRHELDRMYAFAEEVRSGAWKGVTGKRIEHLVSIGIGGSDLGPVMVYEALKPFADAGIDCRYISNIDPNDMAEKVKGLDPETTLVIIVSKTFTTLETLTNAREVKEWMLDQLAAQGAIDGTPESRSEAIAKALCCRLHRARPRGRLWHRPQERLWFLELGRRPLFGGLRGGALAHRGVRPGAL